MLIFLTILVASSFSSCCLVKVLRFQLDFTQLKQEALMILEITKMNVALARIGKSIGRRTMLKNPKMKIKLNVWTIASGKTLTMLSDSIVHTAQKPIAIPKHISVLFKFCIATFVVSVVVNKLLISKLLSKAGKACIKLSDTAFNANELSV